MSDPYKELESLGLTLPSPSAPKGAYVPVVECDKLLFISGALPIGEDDELVYRGRCGDQVTTEQARQAAQRCALHIIARVHEHLGSLARVERVIKLVGFVAATPEFMEHPVVINGASELIGQVFGERGVHSRSAVGVSSLPLGSSVEIEAIVKISR